jgi:glutamyl-tRNA synthetase
MNNSRPRVRIAPSPTGNLHVGTARTALFNELFARHHTGTFIVRIEDTDSARSTKEYEANILEGLRWLGITWDEGPDIGGKYGPYRQSERTGTYTEALARMLAGRSAYYCFCVPRAAGEEKPKRCACADLAWEESSARAAKEKAVIRLRVEAQEVRFEDMIRGTVKAHTDTFGGDFVIAKSLTEPLYHLAVVVDDALMQISHIIRGEDHISNTAKHILLQRALGYAQPQYAHVPLLLNSARGKLSKRSGDTSLLSYRDQGYVAEAMVNFLALLGWHASDDREIYSHQQLIEAFDVGQIQKSGAIFSLEKLGAMNREYIRGLSAEELFERTQPFLEKAGWDVSAIRKQVIHGLQLEQERVTTLAELPEAIAFVLPNWPADYAAGLLVWRKSDQAATRELLTKLLDKIRQIPEEDFTSDALNHTLMAWIDAENLGRGDVLWPMRVALTGREHSPGPFEVAAVVGKSATAARLETALKKLA